MYQFDNYELTTIDYTLKYYLEHNENLDDEDVEWCNVVRKKIDTIMGITQWELMIVNLIIYLKKSMN